MRTLLIAIAALAFLAAPAMAVEVDVQLTIESYAHVQGLETVHITLASGFTTNIGGAWGQAVSNVATTLTATIAETGGSVVGDWDIREISGDVLSHTGPGTTVTALIGYDTDGVNDFAIAVRVQNVPIGSTPRTNESQATLTVTIAAT